MRPQRLAFTLSALAVLLASCDSNRVLDASRGGRIPIEPGASQARRSSATGFATLITLPSLGGTSEALAVNDAGTVIAGYSWERRGTMRAVRWTRAANGSWQIEALPLSASATGATASAGNHAGDVAGNDFPASAPHVVLWSATGGFTMLGCGDTGEAFGLSSAAQVVVGLHRAAIGQPSTASVWQPGSCREELPGLAADAWSRADAVNGDGTIVGGAAALTASGGAFPVRWLRSGPTSQIEQLDQRFGGVRGANAVGDLAGSVLVPCSTAGGCNRAVAWYAAGGSTDLGTLGGDESWARGINAAGEVVGGSSPAAGSNTAFFWSASSGMVQLPFSGRWAAANAISDPRPDGTRLVVGMSSRAQAIAWVVMPP